MYVYMRGCVGACVGEWMDGCMACGLTGWLARWMDGWNILASHHRPTPKGHATLVSLRNTFPFCEGNVPGNFQTETLVVVVLVQHTCWGGDVCTYVYAMEGLVLG